MSSPEIPRPSGPNIGLVLYAALLLTGAGALIWQLVGLPSIEVDLGRVGPGVLVVSGLGLVLVGQLGLLRRRRRERRQQASDPGPTEADPAVAPTDQLP